MAFPAAEGVRRHWEELPDALRATIEARLGAPVVAATTQPGGFSPGLATRLRLADGQRVFLKALSSTPNPQSPEMHRREARVAAALPPTAPAPTLRWAHDDGDWVVLAFEDVDGTHPILPWRPHELTRVLDALAELAAILTPSPVELEAPGSLIGGSFDRWRRLVDGRAGRDGLAPDVLDHLDELAELESGWAEAATGTTLVHLDVRADNLLLTPDRVYLVDWPWAAVGAPWLDLMAMLPSVAMQGGPDPAEVWGASPIGRAADDDRVYAVLAALTGMFVVGALDPPPPGLPTVRAFQAGQGRTAWGWLAGRRGWRAVSRR
ncbi:hypothetical protein BH18ACT1_BH18ACT1_00750 [soil metagenome]